MDTVLEEGEENEMDLEMGFSSAPNQMLNVELPSPSPSPRAPALFVSNSGKALAASNSGKSLVLSNSGKSFMGSNSSKSLLGSNSGNRMDQAGKKKCVKPVTGRHNDTELHLAAQRGDVTAVKEILDEINKQILRTMTGAEFDAEVAEIRAAVVNELGEMALFTAAERGFIDVVKELLPYMTMDGVSLKNRSGFGCIAYCCQSWSPSDCPDFIRPRLRAERNSWPIKCNSSYICHCKRSFSYSECIAIKRF